MVKVKNYFKPAPIQKGKLGQAGFDNPRENIDPHVKTKVISTQEIASGATVLGDLNVLGTLSGGNIDTVITDDPSFVNLSGGHYELVEVVDDLSGQYYILEDEVDSLSGSVFEISGAVGTNTTNISNNTTAITEVSGATYEISGSLATTDGIADTNTAVIASLSGSVYDVVDGNNISGSSISGGNIFVTEDYTTLSGAYVANTVYGTGSTPPTASNFTRGTVYLQYTP